MAATDQDSGQTKSASSQHGETKQKIVSKPKCKRNSRASQKTRKVDRNSAKDVTVNSDVSRPKRRCRRSVHYVESDDQSSSSVESVDESPAEATETVARGKHTAKRQSDKVAQTLKTTGTER